MRKYFKSLLAWFNKEEYDDIFDEVLKSYQGYRDLNKTHFVNG